MPRSSLRYERARKLFLESLESRRLLATFSAAFSAADGAAGSLRAAIISSNGNGQDDTINLSTGYYQLTKGNASGAQENAAATGDLDVGDAGHMLTIQGQGAGTIIDAGEIDRIFQVFGNVRL